MTFELNTKKECTLLKTLTLLLPDQICNSLCCQLYISYKVSSENLVLDQRIIPKLVAIVLIL